MVFMYCYGYYNYVHAYVHRLGGGRSGSVDGGAVRCFADGSNQPRCTVAGSHADESLPRRHTHLSCRSADKRAGQGRVSGDSSD